MVIDPPPPPAHMENDSVRTGNYSLIWSGLTWHLLLSYLLGIHLKKQTAHECDFTGSDNNNNSPSLQPDGEECNYKSWS